MIFGDSISSSDASSVHPAPDEPLPRLPRELLPLDDVWRPLSKPKSWLPLLRPLLDPKSRASVFDPVARSRELEPPPVKGKRSELEIRSAVKGIRRL